MTIQKPHSVSYQQRTSTGSLSLALAIGLRLIGSLKLPQTKYTTGDSCDGAISMLTTACGGLSSLANVSLYVIVRPSVCLSSVTFVHSTQAIEIFGNVSTPCGTSAIRDLCIKILRRLSQGNPFVGG